MRRTAAIRCSWKPARTGAAPSSRPGARGHTVRRRAVARPMGRYREVAITAAPSTGLPAYVRLELYLAGLPLNRAGHIAIAVKRLARDSLRRGSSSATIRLWSDPHADLRGGRGHHRHRPAPGSQLAHHDHEGLWEANQVCDLVQLRSTLTEPRFGSSPGPDTRAIPASAGDGRISPVQREIRKALLRNPPGYSLVEPAGAAGLGAVLSNARRTTRSPPDRAAALCADDLLRRDVLRGIGVAVVQVVP